MNGILYGVGVGPGDPELITIKALRLIERAETIAFPGDAPERSTAFGIALSAVPSLSSKVLIPISAPMTSDSELIKSAHRENAAILESRLKQGKDVVYLTLGDPCIYSTFGYLQKIIAADGFETRYISGVTSFCAAAAALNMPLAEWDEPLHIIPALHQRDDVFDNGNYVFMKSGKNLGYTAKMLSKNGFSVCAAENCGMSGEQLYKGADEIPDKAGYFTIITAKKQQ